MLQLYERVQLMENFECYEPNFPFHETSYFPLETVVYGIGVTPV